jgi:GTP cyclohydrolase I
MSDSSTKPAPRAEAERVSRSDEDPIGPLVQALLREIGEDPSRNGLDETPGRVAKALRFFTRGYQQNPRQILGEALFDVSYDEMVLVKDIEFYSLCEHHMLPFLGRAHVAYIPNGKRSLRPSTRS